MSDKSKTPTGVFVRLPLSTDQEETCFEISERDCMNSAIAAIGTPVESSEISKLLHNIISAGIRKALKINWAGGVFAMHAKADLLAQETMSEMPHTQAALAAAQAESSRLRRALQEIHDTGHDLPEFMRIEMIVAEAEKALKGPEA